jgi:hypothetical protein
MEIFMLQTGWYLRHNANATFAGNVGVGLTGSISPRLQVRGSGTTSATTALRVENTNASASLVVLDNGFVGINTGSAQYNLDVNGNINATSYLGSPNVQFGLVPTSGANTYIRLENTGLVTNGILFNTNNSSNNFRFKHDTNYTFTLGYQNTNAAWFGSTASLVTVNTSAQVQIDSTTKGFLPPRMTNAQRTAISTPAVGLMVYCTDATEGLYIYKSTGWTFIV